MRFLVYTSYVPFCAYFRINKVRKTHRALRIYLLPKIVPERKNILCSFRLEKKETVSNKAQISRLS